MQIWHKLGLSVRAPGVGLLQSHAMLPSPLILTDQLRVYFAACDADLRGRVFYADLENTFPFKVIRISRDPVFSVGQAGAFDADGVNPSQIIARDGKLYMYYIGWQRISSQIPYTLLSGLAVSTDGGYNFSRVQDAPMLAPTEAEPYFRTAPFVWQTGKQWRMLYIGGGEFFTGPGGKRLPRYALRYTESPDGLRWAGSSRVLLEPRHSRDEIGFGRPVLTQRTGNSGELLLSVRTTSGYSLCTTSFSLDTAINPDDLCPMLPLGCEGWDSEMTCFGITVEVNGKELLFYNGDGFGRSGFGLAWRPAHS